MGFLSPSPSFRARFRRGTFDGQCAGILTPRLVADQTTKRMFSTPHAQANAAGNNCLNIAGGKLGVHVLLWMLLGGRSLQHLEGQCVSWRGLSYAVWGSTTRVGSLLQPRKLLSESLFSVVPMCVRAPD